MIFINIWDNNKKNLEIDYLITTLENAFTNFQFELSYLPSKHGLSYHLQ